jgi:hypothetical protein
MSIADTVDFCWVWPTRGCFSTVSVLAAFEAQLAFITMRRVGSDETRQDASLDQFAIGELDPLRSTYYLLVDD